MKLDKSNYLPPPPTRIEKIKTDLNSLCGLTWKQIEELHLRETPPIRIKTPIKTEFAIKNAIKQLKETRKLILKQIKLLENELT